MTIIIFFSIYVTGDATDVSTTELEEHNSDSQDLDMLYYYDPEIPDNSNHHDMVNGVEDSDDDDGDEIQINNTYPQPNTPLSPIFEGSTLTVQSSSILITQYKMRHGITEEALSDLLKLMKIHCPVPNNFPASTFLLKKQLPNLQYPIKIHKFCSTCMHAIDSEVGNTEANCY